MLSEEDKFRIILGHITSRAWSDTGFRTALAADPFKVLGDNGLQPPPGTDVIVYIDTPELSHVICQPQWLSTGTPDIEDRLRDDPSTTLAALGVNIDNSRNYSVLFNRPGLLNIIIPLPPSPAECSIVRLR